MFGLYIRHTADSKNKISVDEMKIEENIAMQSF